ncbi:unnamed protein product [Discosporangium mesarthrocarpum]
MHLHLIMERLKKRYYRGQSALLSDLRLLEQNCVTYNPEYSPIAKRCRKAMARAQDVVRETTR